MSVNDAQQNVLANVAIEPKADVTIYRNGCADILGFYLDKMTLDDCVSRLEAIIPTRRPHHIVLLNAAKIVKAQRDAELAHIIRTADLVGADGVPIVWASRVLGQALPGRVNGTDLMHRLIELAERNGYRLYLLGAKQNVIEKTVATLIKSHPNVKIAGYRNGYFKSVEEEKEAVRTISKSGADILLVGMSSPMKEKWVRRHIAEITVPVIHGVGGSFDILSGEIKRAPYWMQHHGLEWFYRLLQEPRRLWKRYLFTNAIYTIMVVAEVLRLLLGGKKKT
jgi:N-acetylglucosaminyldiphosphoundecaprenol N-acetyl-beta-D-mannosaminyltransferase